MSTGAGGGSPVILNASDQTRILTEDVISQMQTLAIKQGWRIMGIIQPSTKAIEFGMQGPTSRLWDAQTNECSAACCCRCAGLTIASVYVLLLLPMLECISCANRSAGLKKLYAVCKQGIIVAQFSNNGRLVDDGLRGQVVQYRSFNEIGTVEINSRKVVQINNSRGIVQSGEGNVLSTALNLYVEEPEQLHSMLVRMMVRMGKSDSDLSLLQPLNDSFLQVFNNADWSNDEIKQDGPVDGSRVPAPVYLSAPVSSTSAELAVIPRRIMVFIEGREAETQKIVVLNAEKNVEAVVKTIKSTYEKAGVEFPERVELVNTKFNVAVDEVSALFNDDVLMIRTSA